MRESKQPVVYVARELRVSDGDGGQFVMGWFVSKAYLTRKVIDYTTSGTRNCNHIVDFNIGPAIFAIDNNVGIHAENGDGEPKAEIFRDYKSCKEYVNQLNRDRFEYFASSKSAYRWKGYAEEKFKEVMEYAKYLEEKYIPEVERQDKDGLLSALESARGFN